METTTFQVVVIYMLYRNNSWSITQYRYDSVSIISGYRVYRLGHGNS